MLNEHEENDRPPADIELGELVARARDGSPGAWTALVRQFLPLVRAAARAYRLADNDVDDVSQNVWVLLLEHLDRIREPRALPGWLVTTTRRECLRLIRQRGRFVPVDPFAHGGGTESMTDDEIGADLLRVEEAQVLHQGLAELPPLQRDLLLLLCSEWGPSYRDISAALAMPVGSIGPTRARGLARLRATRPVRDYLFPADCDDHRQARPA